MRQEQIFFAGLFAVIAIFAVIILKPFLSFIVLAGILTYALFPLYRFFRDRLRKPNLASALLILLTLLVMVLPTIFLVTELVQQVSGAITGFNFAKLDPITSHVERITGHHVQEIFDTGLEQIRKSMLAIAPNVLGSIGELFLGLFIMFFVMYYGFRDGENFVQRIRQLLPLEPSLKESLFYELRTITQAVLYGQMMTALIQGGFGMLGLLIFGVSNWLFWGAIMTVTAFIPFLGTPIVWVPAAASLILGGNMARGIGLLIYSGILVMNIDNFLRPKLMSGRTQVHPVLILIGVLGGLKVFGFVGLLVGPLILALLVAFVRFYEEAYAQSG